MKQAIWIVLHVGFWRCSLVNIKLITFHQIKYTFLGIKIVC